MNADAPDKRRTETEPDVAGRPLSEVLAELRQLQERMLALLAELAELARRQEGGGK